MRHQCAKLVFSKNHQEREPSMSEITTVGLDLAKHVFQVHGVDAQGTTARRVGGVFARPVIHVSISCGAAIERLVALAARHAIPADETSRAPVAFMIAAMVAPVGWLAVSEGLGHRNI